MHFERARYSDYRDKLQQMFIDHWDEIGGTRYKNLYLALDDSFYTAMEAGNKSLAMVLKDKEEVIGYIYWIVYVHPHHACHVFAQTDCLILNKKHRKNIKAINGMIEMIRESEKILKDEYGVSNLHFSFSAYKDISPIAKRLGYGPEEIMWSKEI